MCLSLSYLFNIRSEQTVDIKAYKGLTFTDKDLDRATIDIDYCYPNEKSPMAMDVMGKLLDTHVAIVRKEHLNSERELIALGHADLKKQLKSLTDMAVDNLKAIHKKLEQKNRKLNCGIGIVAMSPCRRCGIGIVANFACETHV